MAAAQPPGAPPGSSVLYLPLRAGLWLQQHCHCRLPAQENRVRGALRWAEGQPLGARRKGLSKESRRALRGIMGSTHAGLLSVSTPSRPLRDSTPSPGPCPLPAMPFSSLSAWQTFILQTCSGSSLEGLSLMPPPVMLTAPSPGLLSTWLLCPPSSAHHPDCAAGSPAGTPTTLEGASRARETWATSVPPLFT